MEKISCHDCKADIHFIEESVRKYNDEKHYAFCKSCLKTKNICSFSKCKQIFFLCDKDLQKLKYIYISNSKNKKRFFIFSDIQNLVVKKYGNYDNFKKISLQKKRKEIEKKERIKKIMNKRMIKLNKALQENKLELKNHGDCYSFVKYGKPSVEEVIENELKKLDEKRIRKIELAKELSKIDIILDETLPSCYNYINCIGCKNLSETIRQIEIEYFFKMNTSYDKFLLEHGPEKAKQLALMEFKSSKNNDSVEIPNKISKVSNIMISFE